MHVDTSKLNQEAAVRYSTANTVRMCVRRMGGTVVPDWKNDYIRIVPKHERTAIKQRCFEIDHRVELGAHDTEAPFLTDHHLNNAQFVGNRLIEQVFQETRMCLPGGVKLKSVYEQLRSIPQDLRDRIEPAMYCAQKEIDPTGMFAAEYDRLQAAFECALDGVMQGHKMANEQSSNSPYARKKLRDTTLMQFECVVRQQWIGIAEWIDQAKHYLTGKYLYAIDKTPSCAKDISDSGVCVA